MGLLLVLSMLLACGACSSSLRIPVLGNYSETFFWYVEISVGSVPFTVTIDTGSSDLLVPAVGCTGCFGGDPSKYYPLDESHLVPCNVPGLACRCSVTPHDYCVYSVTYGGSLTEDAIAVHDQVSLGTGWTGQVRFGAAYNVSQGNVAIASRRRQQASDYPEGIWGLAYSQLNSLGTTTLLDTLANATGRPNIFALCLEEQGGLMVIGETPAWGSWQFANVYKPGFWQVEFQNVLVSGVSLGPSRIFNNPGIVDSGTPFFTLPSFAYNAFLKLLLSNCTNNHLAGFCGLPANETVFAGACFDLSANDIASWPAILVEFTGGASITITPQMYLIPMFQCTAGGVSLAVVSDPTFTVISGSVLLHFDTVFDKDLGRVGFLEKTGKCATR